jgi:type IV pilus assembly protein PilM
MLGFRRYAIGVELTDSMFKMVELKRSLRKVRLSQYVVHPLLPMWMGKRSIIEPEELIQSIRETLSNRRLHTRQVRLALGNRHVVTASWQVPEMRRSRMRRWIENKVLPEWDLPFDDPVFDFQVLGHVWQDGDRQKVVVAATSRRYVEELTDLLQWCGLELVAVDLTALSLGHWFDYSDDGTVHKWASIHMTPIGVDVSLFYQGALQGTSHVPLTMRSFLEGMPDRPSTDPLRPILKNDDEVAAYSKALWQALHDLKTGWIGEELWKRNRVWVVTGEGIDVQKVLLRLQSQEADLSLRVGEGPQSLMTGDLQLHSSRHLGNVLSAPLGAALTGVGIA